MSLPFGRMRLALLGLALVFSGSAAVSVSTPSKSGAASLARLMEVEDLSLDRRRQLMDALPAMADDAHEFSAARRPLTLPGRCVTVHVLLPGSQLAAVASVDRRQPLSRVLCGRVLLAAAVAASAGREMSESCSCFGGEVCPRPNCRWRRVAVADAKNEGPVLDGGSTTFDPSLFDARAKELSVVIDVGCEPRRPAGAMRLAALGPWALAEKLWPQTDDLLAERERWFEGLDPETTTTPSPPAKPSPTTTSKLDASIGVAGMDEVLAVLDTRVRLPLAAPPKILAELGVKPVRGVVFHGPPGCGKSLLARKVAETLAAEEPTVVAAPQLLDKYLGGSEENIRQLFAKDDPTGGLHCVVLDEIDAIATRRSDHGGTAGGADRARDSIVNQLLSILDGVAENDPDESHVLVLATTNRLDLLDPALLRPGRFEVHVRVDPPDRDGRRDILRLHTAKARQSGRLADDATHALDTLAQHDLPDGTTGATIAAVVRLAASFALRRYFEKHDANDAVLTLDDFRAAIALILQDNRPS